MKKFLLLCFIILITSSLLISGEIGLYKKGTKLEIVKKSSKVISDTTRESLNLKTESTDSLFGYNWRVVYFFKDKKLDKIGYTTPQQDIPELLDRFKVCLLNLTKILGEPDEVNEDYSQYYSPHNFSNRFDKILKGLKSDEIFIKINWLGKEPVELMIILEILDKKKEVFNNLFVLYIPGKISFANNVEILTKNNIEKHSKNISIEEQKEEPQFDHNFRNANWGMSKAQIKKIENSELFEEDDSGLVYRGNVGTFNTDIVYVFTNNKLSRGAYFIKEKHTNENLYINDYNKIQGILKDKYGSPTVDEIDWIDDLYKDDYYDWGFAVSIGDLRYFSLWRVGKTDIIHSLKGDNYQISHAIVYQNAETLKESEKKQTDGF